MKNTAAKILILFGSLWRSSKGVPTFTLGSTSGKSDQALVDYDDVLSNYDYSYDYYNNYGSIPSQCGLSYEDSGYFESIHPYLARTSCLYNVTASEELEVRISRLQLEVTEDCLYDNIQVYSGHEMLSLSCGENPYKEWTKIKAKHFGIFFDGFSGGHYGFKLHWRPARLSTTTTTTTTTTTSTTTINAPRVNPSKRKLRIPKKSKQKKTGKNRKSNRLSELGFIALVNHKYEKLISSRQQKAGNKTFQKRLITKFATLVENVFDNKDRKEKLRKCAIKQGDALENSEIPNLFRIQIETATTESKIVDVIKKVIVRQDGLCRADGRRKPDHPKRWLTWFNWRSEKLESLKEKNLVL